MDAHIGNPGSRSADTYDLIAEHYDEFTRHHDYDSWLGALLPALEARGLRGNRLLDAGCGTGKSTIPMLDRGWEITACDNSAGMLDRLREKAGGRARIEEQDLLDLPKMGEFDLVLCLGDVLNYCAATGPLTPAFAGLRRNLAPGGLLLFDLNTLATYRTFYAQTIQVPAGEGVVTWRGRGDGSAAEGGIAESVMSIESRAGDPVAAVHRQRHVPREEVLASMARAGLECIDLFGQGFDAVLEKPLEEDRHTKAVYIAGEINTHEEEGR